MNKREIATEAVLCLNILKELAEENKDIKDAEVRSLLDRYYQLLLDYSKEKK